MKIGDRNVLLCILVSCLNLHWWSLLSAGAEETTVAEDTYMLRSAADAFDLVFSAVGALDEPCRVAYQNCVLNENNNKRLDMTRRCDVIAKAVLCMDERESFVNSECELDARLEARLGRYRAFFVDVFKRCELDDDDEDDDFTRLRLSSSGTVSSKPFLVTLLTTLFLMFTHSIYSMY